MASEFGEAGGLSQYIDHHLHHLANKHQEGLLDFSVVNLDTVFFSLLSAAIIRGSRPARRRPVCPASFRRPSRCSSRWSGQCAGEGQPVTSRRSR